MCYFAPAPARFRVYFAALATLGLLRWLVDFGLAFVALALVALLPAAYRHSAAFPLLAWVGMVLLIGVALHAGLPNFQTRS